MTEHYEGPISGMKPVQDGKVRDSIKIAVLNGVREYGEGLPVEIWLDGETGRLVLSAYNQCGDGFVNIDISDLISWLQTGRVDSGALSNG